MAELAQFPLQSVLLPGMPLGLQIFEPRYVQLLEDVASVDDRFGVVLITRGSEVGGDDVRGEVGVIAQISRKRDVGDGRWMIDAFGGARFRVKSWLADDPYPRADIELSPQSLGGGGADVIDVARQRFDEFVSLVGSLGVDTSQLALADDPTRALYEMTSTVPISTFDRYQVLACDTVALAAPLLSEAISGATEILRGQLGQA